MSATVQIRRAADRAVTTTPWLTSRHSFSFGDHYDPANTHHGLLLVSNDDVVAPAAGFDTHPHRDMEIVTWVLDGALEHRDSEGNSGVVYPGLAQRMSAGTGISHSEKNASDTEPVRFVQMWVQPDVSGIAPGYQHHEISGDELDGKLVAVASGIPGHDAAITIHNRSAALHVARLRSGDELALPSAPYVHLFVARGRLTMNGAELAEGDAVRMTASIGAQVAARERAEILVWEMHAALGD
ncbi:pirin family protein [Mycobacterium cookii]|uniref:Putative quercetin 2,3-dioxygenase n=1 Tax=Mycobacterium cookii TaxID=1775 RepID=A0A7I7KZF0_9MYCO|nr:pirin-like bicupin family protein [Mycobacterium cookii]MCV7330324.1 pirin family protein [Mycobacterium cookii]BBX47490.1 putative quercetin 2,3-dioxygenase [Mycobacterium cookii]